MPSPKRSTEAVTIFYQQNIAIIVQLIYGHVPMEIHTVTVTISMETIIHFLPKAIIINKIIHLITMKTCLN